VIRVVDVVEKSGAGKTSVKSAVEGAGNPLCVVVVV